MPFSAYLNGMRGECKELVSELGKSFEYVSVLGSDIHAASYRADRKNSAVQESSAERGFVIKMNNGRSFFEYSLDDISGDKAALAAKIIAAVKTDPSLEGRMISADAVRDEPLEKDFVRESDFDNYDDEYLLNVCREITTRTLSVSDKVLNAVTSLQPYSVSKLFVSKNRMLTQHYGWAVGNIIVIYNGEKMSSTRKTEYSNMLSEVIEKLKDDPEKAVDLAYHLSTAKAIEPGVYDVITDCTVSGLIAHEAFGHGVEMDQFVKDRALAKQYVGKYVASPITNMRDGAASAFSVASYFFDDDGVPAHDTQIIKDGILVAGLSDLTSATELGTEPTGNGRRDSYKRKAYARMTNTFFEPGKDKLEDMIASIKHGYYLVECSNGMEDPKNWQIQCTAEYGIEIVDGKLTDNYVSPVVMSGYVPDLLKSISMVSDRLEVIGVGSCGKGYKEWVRVSDGGPELKARCKLG